MEIAHPATPAEFAAAVTPYLAQHEIEHGLLIGLVGAGRASPPPRWAYAALARDDERVAAVGLRTDDRLVLSRATSDHALPLLARDALAEGRAAGLRMVNGPPASVAAFAAASGSAWRVTMRQGVYAVHTLLPPPTPAGAHRVATPGDLDTLAAWTAAFEAEALGAAPTIDAMRARVAPRIAAGEVHVWEVDGEVVASAAAAGPTPRGIRVNFVYTPPARRGRGYAGALVASLTRRLLDGGRAFVFLHADLANPVANRIYRRMGYALVAEMHVLEPA